MTTPVTATPTGNHLNRRPTADEVISRMKIATNTKTDVSLAKVIGVSKVTVSCWRTRNAITPCLEYCLEISERFGTSLDFLFFGDGAAPIVSTDTSDDAWMYFLSVMTEGRGRTPLSKAYRHTAKVAADFGFVCPSFGAIRARWEALSPDGRARFSGGATAVQTPCNAV